MIIISALLSFIVVLFPLIIIHEFGHFLVGKWLGAKPEVFSLGFGKALLKWQWLGATFQVGPIPLGGYVKFKAVQFEGENGEGEANPKISAWRWIPIALAGPATNLLFTFVVFFALAFTAMGTIDSQTVLTAKDSSLVGSKVLTSKHSEVQGFLSKMILGKSGAKKFILKGEKTSELTAETEATLTLSEARTIPWYTKLAKGAGMSGAILWSLAEGPLIALAKLVSESKGYKQLAGPVGIASEANKAKDEGVLHFILLMAYLSFALAYFNLLPLTFLDGGRALIALYETVVRKSINLEVLGKLNLLGLIIMLCLFMTGLFSDAMRLLDK